MTSPPTAWRKHSVCRFDSDPRALAIPHEWMKTTVAEMNEARLHMTRIPKALISSSTSTRCRGRLASGIAM